MRNFQAIHDFAIFPSSEEEYELDIHIKKSVKKIAASVVCLESYSGNNQLFICCGIIMDCQSSSGSFIATVLTSATLLRCPNSTTGKASDLKINVYMVGGKSVEGKVVAADFHYNIAIIQIYSDVPLPIPTIKLVDVTVDLSLSEPQLVNNQDCVTSNRIPLFPGDKVFALGRFFRDPYHLMIASGEFSFYGCSFGCVELLKASWKIKKNGIGGPLINMNGEVIGINFYSKSFTPFLPMNIVLKCYEDLKSHGCASRPWIGVVGCHIYASVLHNLEIVCNKFPYVTRGFILIKVLPNSPAERAGLSACDVIVSCCGAPVGSFSELTEMMWGKEGKTIELVVARPSSGQELKLVVDSVEANPMEYRWLVPKMIIVRQSKFF